MRRTNGGALALGIITFIIGLVCMGVFVYVNIVPLIAMGFKTNSEEATALMKMAPTILVASAVAGAMTSAFNLVAGCVAYRYRKAGVALGIVTIIFWLLVGSAQGFAYWAGGLFTKEVLIFCLSAAIPCVFTIIQTIVAAKR